MRPTVGLLAVLVAAAPAAAPGTPTVTIQGFVVERGEPGVSPVRLRLHRGATLWGALPRLGHEVQVSRRVSAWEVLGELPVDEVTLSPQPVLTLLH